MESFEESLKNLFQNDREKNVVLGQIAFNQLLESMPSNSVEEREISLWIVISACLKVIDLDRTRSESELKFLSDVAGLELTYELIDEKTALFPKQTEMFLKNVKDTDDIVKNNFISLAALLCYCDGSINDVEIKFLEGFTK